MSTKIKHVQTISPAERKRRKELRRIKRNIRMVVFCILVCTIIVMAICYSKGVQALEGQIQTLTDQVTLLERENYTLGCELIEKERTLGMFIDDNEVSAASPVTYNIPLDAALQEYAYNLCVDYCIPEHYELVLAIMWQESNFEADAVSSTDDYGLMQINKVNHGWLRDELGVDDFLDEHQNIHAGIYTISKLIHKYGNDDKALMAYNMGERGAASYWEAGIYSTSYSNSVIAKRAAIEADNYKSN